MSEGIYYRLIFHPKMTPGVHRESSKRPGTGCHSYLFSRLAADALAADLSSFAELSPFLGLTAFFAVVLFFAGFAFGDLADFFTIVARN